jgi:hypothetical protein
MQMLVEAAENKEKKKVSIATPKATPTPVSTTMYLATSAPCRQGVRPLELPTRLPSAPRRQDEELVPSYEEDEGVAKEDTQGVKEAEDTKLRDG